jgi:GT2 family glycosyltransferase
MSYKDFSIVIVDNGSSDSSVEHIKDWASGRSKHDSIYPDHPTFQNFAAVEIPIEFLIIEQKEFLAKEFDSESVYKEKFELKLGNIDIKKARLILIDTKKNLGYAGGNNVGIRYAINHLESDYVLLLNPDTVVSPDLLEKLLEVFRVENNVGMCGPIEYSYELPHCIQGAGGRFGLYTGRHQLFKTASGTRKVVDWVMGSCMFIEKSVFFTTGFFDERFFLYIEEIDFAYRVKKNGYKTYVTPDTFIWHKGGTKGGRTHDALYDFYIMRNRLLFSLKHLNFFQLFIFIPIHFKKLITFSLRDLIMRKESNFLKRVKAIKEGFLAYNERIKNYNTIE